MDPGRRITTLTAIGTDVTHPIRQNEPFGKFKFPFLGRTLQGTDSLRRKRAIQTLCDLVMDSIKVATKEFSGIIPILKEVCRDVEDEVRIGAARCLGSVNATASGRRVFHLHDLYKEALALLCDENELVRKETNLVFPRLVISPMGAQGLVDNGAIPVLISRIPKEEDYILENLLHTLHICCLIDPEQAVEAEGLEAVVPLLKNHTTRVTEKAATVLKDLTIEPLARNKALELSSVALLIDLCTHEDSGVKAKSLSALMMMVNAIPVKFQAIEEKAIQRILPLTNSDNVEIRLNAIKILTVLSETPTGREILMGHLVHIKKLLNENFVEVQYAAKKLHEVVTFNA